MITREITSELLAAASEYPAVTVLGPRQSGKTTLVQMTFPGKPYVSLEEPDIRMVAEEDPRGFLAQYPEGAVLDEIQRVPLLLSYLQGIIDRARKTGMFILTGRHQPELQQGISQSLAGRTAVLTLYPFAYEELQSYRRQWETFELVVMGAYPRLHEDRLQTGRFFGSYVQTYVERDVRALINLKDLRSFQHFLVLLAGRIGQVVNYSSLSNDVGVSGTTIKNWISVLKASFVVWELSPYFENIGKRVIKSPKIYFCDTGLAAFLLGIETVEQAARDPLRGALFENLVLLEILKKRLNAGRRPDLYFFRDTNGNEVDLIIKSQRELIPVEIKSAATFTPHFIKGIERFRQAAGDRCQQGHVLYNGEKRLTFKGVRIDNPFLKGAFP
jgi:predicted AAA+ superfamily ATPase